MSVYSGPEIVNQGLVYHLDAYNYNNFQGSIPTKNYIAFTPQYQSWDPSPTFAQDIRREFIDSETLKLFTVDGRGFTAIWWSGFSPGSEIQFSRKFSYSAYVRGVGSAEIQVHQSSSLPNNPMQSGGGSGYTALNPSTWQRLSIKNWYTSNAVGSQSILVALTSGVGNYVEIKNVQFEYQDEPSTYVNGSRLTVPDLSGNSNNTTFLPSPYYTTNSLGISGLFSGTVSNNVISGIPDGSPNFTISGWVRYSSINDYSAWFEKQSGFVGNRMDFGYIRSLSLLYFTGWNLQSNSIVESGTTLGYVLAPNTWVNLTIACAENSIRMFVNGSFTASASNTMNFPNSSHPVGIGGYLRKLNGDIGSMMMYSRQLTDSEVLQNFNATRARYGI